MSWFTKIRDAVVKPALAVVAAPFTGGASMAALAADAAAPAGSMSMSKAAEAAPAPAAPVLSNTAMMQKTLGDTAAAAQGWFAKNKVLALSLGGALLVVLVGWLIIRKRG